MFVSISPLYSKISSLSKGKPFYNIHSLKLYRCVWNLNWTDWGVGFLVTIFALTGGVTNTFIVAWVVTGIAFKRGCLTNFWLILSWEQLISKPDGYFWITALGFNILSSIYGSSYGLNSVYININYHKKCKCAGFQRHNHLNVLKEIR